MTDEVFNLIERLANLLRQETRLEGQSLGLQPIQQEALYYLSSCNKYSDTTLAVTEYLGLTKGTVSQTLTVLENKSLIEREKDQIDRRITHLKITAAGKKFLEQTYPPQKFTHALSQLSVSEKTSIDTKLRNLLQHYQIAVSRKGFGVCKQCKYNQSSQNGFVCGLTKESLTDNDVKLICREFLS